MVLGLILCGLTVCPAADVETVTYARTDDRELTADIYRPSDGRRGPPVIVLVHGGGWKSGTKQKFSGLAEALAAEGFGVVNIDYRLSGEAKFPVALQDVKRAIAWTRVNAADYGFDAGRVYLVGGSAGGHLAALAAATPQTMNPSDVTGPQPVEAVVIMGSGVDQVSRAKAGGPVPNAIAFFGGTVEEVPEVYEAASPITHVSSP